MKRKANNNITIQIDGPRRKSHPIAISLMIITIIGVIGAAVWFLGFSEWGYAWSGNTARQLTQSPEDVITSYPSVTLSVDKVSIMLEPGETARLKTSVQFDKNQAGIKGIRLRWRSQNPHVAYVDSTGVITAVGIGTATVAVTVANNDIDSNPAYCLVTVRQWQDKLN